MGAPFLSQEWADAVREAVNIGPDEVYKGDKLEEYWDWIAQARSTFEGHWAFGVRDGDSLRDEAVVLTYSGGECAKAEATSVDSLPEGVFLLAGELEAWRDLMSGYDAGKSVMYRRLLLDRGNLLQFFNRVYFFVEMLAVIGKVPTEFPAEVAA